MKNIKIAIIEDDQVIAQMYRMKFESEGCEVQMAENGKLGVELCEQMKPDMILLDLKMPRIDGRAALRELRRREQTRHVPVVVISSSDQQRDVKDCYELGANSCVVKQFNPYAPGEYLVDTVRYWLDMNQPAH